MNYSGIQSNALKSTLVNYSGEWSQEKWCKGTGFIIEGKIVGRRRQTIKTTEKDIPNRLLCIQIEIVGDIIRREYDSNGVELVPKISLNQKNVKGYLHHFDSRESKALNTESIDFLVKYEKELSNSGLISNEILGQLHPNKKNVAEFWGNQDSFLNVEMKNGDTIRLKTKGDSTIVDTLTLVGKQNQTNFQSGATDLGDNWMSKISNISDNDMSNQTNEEENDDEWD